MIDIINKNIKSFIEEKEGITISNHDIPIISDDKKSFSIDLEGVGPYSGQYVERNMIFLISDFIYFIKD